MEGATGMRKRQRSLLSTKLLLLIVLPLGSCGKDDDSGLDFWITPNESFIIPGTLDDLSTSCYDNDIAGPRIHFESMNTTWKGEGVFYPVLVQLTFKANGFLSSEYSCELVSGDNGTLASILGADSGAKYLETGADLTSKCPIECGGIQINDESKDRGFKLTGQAKLVGYSLREEDGVPIQEPVTKKTKITIRNLKQ